MKLNEIVAPPSVADIDDLRGLLNKNSDIGEALQDYLIREMMTEIEIMQEKEAQGITPNLHGYRTIRMILDNLFGVRLRKEHREY